MSERIVDDNLIVRIGREDKEAFGELYLASSSIVYGYALSILKSRHDAEDAMHDAFVRIYQCAPSYRPMGKPLAWILTIVRNLCYNALRSKKPVLEIERFEGALSTNDEQASIDRIALEKALEILDLQERQIVFLHALTGLKHREIADLMDIPVGTVLSKRHRALQKLRNELGEGAAL